jgi:hypothetical protein
LTGIAFDFPIYISKEYKALINNSKHNFIKQKKMEKKAREQEDKQQGKEWLLCS